MSSLSNRFMNAILAAAMAGTKSGAWKAFLDATHDPEGVQEALLLEILRTNAETEFGKRHRFGEITGTATYRDLVPVHDYEALRPYVEKQDKTKHPWLTSEQPVMFAQTSGTTGSPKLIPLTQTGIERLRNCQRLFAYAQYAGSSFYRGRILAIGSPAIEGHLETGTPYGSATGLIYETMPWAIRKKFVLSPEVLSIADYQTKYYVIAALGLREREITGLATANPSTLLKLLETIAEHAAALIGDIATGRLGVADRLSEQQADAIAAQFRPNPRRARQLEEILHRDGALRVGDIWPGLEAVVTWTGGSCRLALSALVAALPDRTRIIELGYTSSEFRGSIMVNVDGNRCVPTLSNNFFEFVERGEWETEKPNFLSLHQIEPWKQYYLFVTTPEGLYRYDMNDIVEVTGRFNATPTIAFVQKGKGVTNITGEKLYESQVMQAMQLLRQDDDLTTPFFMVLADEAASQYRLYLECARTETFDAADLGERFDGHLRRLNVEYDAKRASGRLKPLSAAGLRPGTGDLYRQHCLAKGQRDGQFKVLPLQFHAKCSFDFEACRDRNP